MEVMFQANISKAVHRVSAAKKFNSLIIHSFNSNAWCRLPPTMKKLTWLVLCVDSEEEEGLPEAAPPSKKNKRKAPAELDFSGSIGQCLLTSGLVCSLRILGNLESVHSVRVGGAQTAGLC
jgi:hypothetical protein